MIIFTADSARHIIKLLDTSDGRPVDFLFFNDGSLTRKVVKITRVCEDFDCNGMTMEIPQGYHLQLEDGNTMRLALDVSGTPPMKPMATSQDEPGTLKSWIEAGVHLYHF